MNLKTRVLALLTDGAQHSAWELANWLNVPDATIRRVIRELRADGHNISFAPYRLGV